MKILLIGEYSSLHNYLKEGLLAVDPTLDITLAAVGDGWKKIPGADIILFNLKDNSRIGKIKDLVIEPWKKVKRLKGYDIVQFINPMIFHYSINPLFIHKLVKSNKNVSLISAGYDCALVDAYCSGRQPYYIFDFNKWLVKWYKGMSAVALSNRISNHIILKSAKCIIPSLYEYSVGYSGNKLLERVVPFPINTDKILYHDNIVKNKIVFFHGVNRESEKGTPFIRKALERLKQDYPDDVEIVIEGHMPFKKYIDVMNRANIVIDQCCSYGYGINACIAMAQGKVVMSGASKETIEAFGVDYCPIIEVKPDVDFIYQQCVKLLKCRDQISDIGYKSREYVEKVHNYKKIAHEYMKIWDKRFYG